jgi:hypothetical protein
MKQNKQLYFELALHVGQTVNQLYGVMAGKDTTKLGELSENIAELNK